MKNTAGNRPCSDGPASPLFSPIPLAANGTLEELAGPMFSEQLRESLLHAPSGDCVCWGIPFRVDAISVVRDDEVQLTWPEVRAGWVVVLHTTDMASVRVNPHGFIPASRGEALLGERVADYVFLYSDGTEKRVSIRRQRQIGMVWRPWGLNCFEAVAHRKPHPVQTLSDRPRPGATWGATQFRLEQPDMPLWVNWLWAWQNPYPERGLAGLRIEPGTGTLILSALTAGDVSETPLRWEQRKKAILRLSE